MVDGTFALIISESVLMFSRLWA